MLISLCRPSNLRSFNRARQVHLISLNLTNLSHRTSLLKGTSLLNPSKPNPLQCNHLLNNSHQGNLTSPPNRLRLISPPHLPNRPNRRCRLFLYPRKDLSDNPPCQIPSSKLNHR